MGDPDVAALHEDSTVKARIREITRAWPLQRRLGRWQGAELSAVLKINGLKPGGNRDAMISRIQTYMERGPLPKCPTCEKTYLRWVQADGRWRPGCPGSYGGKDVGMIACAGPQEVIPIPPFTWGENVAVRQTPAKQPPSEMGARSHTNDEDQAPQTGAASARNAAPVSAAAGGAASGRRSLRSPGLEQHMRRSSGGGSTRLAVPMSPLTRAARSPSSIAESSPPARMPLGASSPLSLAASHRPPHSAAAPPVRPRLLEATHRQSEYRASPNSGVLASRLRGRRGEVPNGAARGAALATGCVALGSAQQKRGGDGCATRNRSGEAERGRSWSPAGPRRASKVVHGDSSRGGHAAMSPARSPVPSTHPPRQRVPSSPAEPPLEMGGEAPLASGAAEKDRAGCHRCVSPIARAAPTSSGWISSRLRPRQAATGADRAASVASASSRAICSPSPKKRRGDGGAARVSELPRHRSAGVKPNPRAGTGAAAPKPPTRGRVHRAAALCRVAPGNLATGAAPATSTVVKREQVEGARGVVLPQSTLVRRRARQKALKKIDRPLLKLRAVSAASKAATEWLRAEGTLPEYEGIEAKAMPRFRRDDLSDLAHGVESLVSKVVYEYDRTGRSMPLVQPNDILRAASAFLAGGSDEASRQVATDPRWPEIGGFFKASAIKDNFLRATSRDAPMFDPDAVRKLQNLAWRCVLAVMLSALSQHRSKKQKFLRRGQVRTQLEAQQITIYGVSDSAMHRPPARRWAANAIQPRVGQRNSNTFK